MSKYFCLFLLTFFLISFSSPDENKSSVEDEEGAYASYLIKFFSGMADNDTNSLCIQTVKQNREEINEIIDGMLSMLGKFEDLVRIYGFKLIKIPGLIKNCQFANLFKVYFHLTNETMLREIGKGTVNCSLNITNAIKEYGDFFKSFGYVSKVLFDLKIR